MKQEIIIYAVLVMAMVSLSYYLWCDCNCSQNYICKAAIKPVKENLGLGGGLFPRKHKRVVVETTTEEKPIEENFNEETPEPNSKSRRIFSI